MREYMEVAQKNPHKYDPQQYELLVPEKDMLSVELVSSERIVSNAYDDQEELALICKQIELGKKLRSEQG